MKLVFSGPLRDFSGYAQFARNFAATLHKSELFDLVCRPISYDQRDGQTLELPDWLEGCCKKDLYGVDVFIQNTTLNIEANPAPGVMNGIYFFWETDRIPPAWVQKANMFDFIMVPCKMNARALAMSGVTKPILVLSPSFDMSVYDKNYEQLDIANTEGRTIFYNICQLTAKKGVDALLRAYYAAFADRPDEVLLVLKTYINMANRQNEIANIKKFVEDIQRGCRIPVKKYPPVLPVTDIVSDEEIHQLHRAGHAYVCSSRGEGFCIPAFEAMAHGTTVISNNWGGLEQFVNNKTALVYGGCMTNVFNMGHSDPSLYTGAERWFEPSVSEMSDLMRVYHLLRKGNEHGTLVDDNKTEWEKVEQTRQNGQSFVRRFETDRIAKKVGHQLVTAYKNWKESGKVEFDMSKGDAKVLEVQS